MHLSPAAGGRIDADTIQQRTPEAGLPTQRLRHRLQSLPAGGDDVPACGPVLQPVRPIDLVLVEEVGQSLGKLVTLAQIGVALQEAAQRLEHVFAEQARQDPHQAPGQHRLVER